MTLARAHGYRLGSARHLCQILITQIQHFVLVIVNMVVHHVVVRHNGLLPSTGQFPVHVEYTRPMFFGECFACLSVRGQCE